MGAYIGGIIADRYPTPRTLGWLLFLSGLAGLSIAPLTEAVARWPLQSSLMFRILTVTTIIFFGPSCLLGMISPVVVRLSLDRLDRSGNVVGKIYGFSTLGSILGTFATGFFLISYLGTRNILLLMALILILSSPFLGELFFAAGYSLYSSLLYSFSFGLFMVKLLRNRGMVTLISTISTRKRIITLLS